MTERPNKLVNGKSVPLTDAEFADYLERLNAPPPAPPPRTVLIGWFNAALSQMGHLAAVQAAVAGEPEWKRILWEYATSVVENDADVVRLAGALNINLKAVFDRADQIRAAVRGNT